MQKPSRFRVHAFLWHVLFSGVIAVVSWLLVFYVWHPAPLAKAVGVGDIFLMMLAIDVVLGPILTFTVAKEGKKTLKSDLAIIVVLQVAALIYGLHSIAVNRPVAVAFDLWRFEVAHANDIKPESLQRAAAPFNQLSWGQPEWVAIRPAANTEEKNTRLFNELNGKGSPAMYPDLYEPLDKAWDNINKEGLALSELKKFNPPETVDAVLKQYPTADKFIPMKASRVDMTVLINTKDKQIVKVVDLRPWQ